MLSKLGVTRIMHNYLKGRVNYHILFKRVNYPVISTYDIRLTVTSSKASSVVHLDKLETP